MAEANGQRRWWEAVSQILGWGVPLLLAWGFAVQRQSDLNSVRIEQLERMHTTQNNMTSDVLSTIRAELSALRATQSSSFNEVVQRLARVEAKVEK